MISKKPRIFLLIILYCMLLQKAFDFQVDKDEVSEQIRSKLRMEAAPIPYYLFSRYDAGSWF